MGVVAIFRSRNKSGEEINANNGDGAEKQLVPSKISECETLVKSIFGNSSDIVIQSFDTKKEKAMVVFVDGMVNKDLVDRDVIRPIKSPDFDGDIYFALKTVYKEAEDMTTFVDDVLTGIVAVFYEGSKKVILMELRGWNQRSVTEPPAESVIRGPKEGFNENIRVNSALIRRKIKTPKLIFESFTLGRQTKTKVELVYISGIVNREVLSEVKQRLAGIDVDAVLESGYIEQYLEKNTFSPFSGIGLSQKPDVVAARILEGRVAVLCDGTPHVLTIPDLFIENIHTSEDYYNRVLYSSAIRLIRFVGLFITVMLPGIAVAIFTYNAQMLPSVFLTSLISSTQKTPMPIFAEIFLLTVMFELLKEAGTRLPQAVGSAITIVGSLIIGEAAVNAGIVSEPSVIIVAITAVSSFLVPNLFEFTLMYRALFWLLGSTMGLIGVGAGVVIMLTQLISTHSFGIPVMSSFSKNELKDGIVRFPLRSMKFRPKTIAKDNVKRQA